MIKEFHTVPVVPEASICINKSQLKVYNKHERIPTYYLDNGQEFQIQLFNPTQDTILAKIQLNNKPISQGGLVLKPGERVFLERYLDVAKKFLFETYEVYNTNLVKQAIANNGDFKVEFFKENDIVPISRTITTTWPNLIYPDVYYMDANKFDNQQLIGNNFLRCDVSMDSLDFMDQSNHTTNVNPLGSYGMSTNTGTDTTSSQIEGNNINSYFSHTEGFGGASSLCSGTYSTTLGKQFTSPSVPLIEKDHSKKTIETGRVEAGSDSNQQITYVNKSFQYVAFHTIEYKMLPTSQKINTAKDIHVARYCHNCANKIKQEHKFCSACGVKQ